MQKNLKGAGQPACTFKFFVKLSWAAMEALIEIGRWPTTEIFIILALVLWGPDRAESLMGLLGRFRV